MIIFEMNEANIILIEDRRRDFFDVIAARKRICYNIFLSRKIVKNDVILRQKELPALNARVRGILIKEEIFMVSVDRDTAAKDDSSEELERKNYREKFPLVGWVILLR